MSTREYWHTSCAQKREIRVLIPTFTVAVCLHTSTCTVQTHACAYDCPTTCTHVKQCSMKSCIQPHAPCSAGSDTGSDNSQITAYLSLPTECRHIIRHWLCNITLMAQWQSEQLALKTCGLAYWWFVHKKAIDSVWICMWFTPSTCHDAGATLATRRLRNRNFIVTGRCDRIITTCMCHSGGQVAFPFQIATSLLQSRGT